MTDTLTIPKYEVWSPVNGWPNYHVSSFGNVISTFKGCAKLLNLKPDTKGYIKVRLYDSGRNKIFGVHQLVALHFCRKLNTHTEVHHKDANKLNNIYSNLEWVARGRHIEITIKETGFGKGVQGEKHGMSKLTNESVLKIRTMYLSGDYSQPQIAKIYGVNRMAIFRVVNNKSWKHL